MGMSRSRGGKWCVPLCVLALMVLLPCTVCAQASGQVSGGGHSLPQAGGHGPLNTVGSAGPRGHAPQADGSADSVSLSNSLLQGILPEIPRLKWGYLWTFGNQRQGRLVLDYMLPIAIGRDIVFGEFHGRFEDFIKAIRGNRDPNLQILLGGGYRKRVTDDFMVGVNGFWNSRRVFGQWRSAGILGLEMCTVMPGDGIFDANMYWFGNPLDVEPGPINAFKNGRADFKVEGAYSQSVFEKSLILRVKISRYVFHQVDTVRGFYVGSDVRTSDGMYRVDYVYGYDVLNRNYHNLGLYVTVGFRVEKIFSRENPFSKP